MLIVTNSFIVCIPTLSFSYYNSYYGDVSVRLFKKACVHVDLNFGRLAA